MSKKKLGVKGMLIHSQAREVVNNVRIFMFEEAKNGLKIPLEKYRQRVLEATGVSRSTYQNVMKQSNHIEIGASTSFASPSRQRSRKFKVLEEVSVEEIEAIRRFIYDFFIIEKRRPTLRCILQKMKDAQFSFSGGKTTLWRLCKKIGFSWKKTEDNSKILMESYDIRLKRINYLRKIQQYRAENRNIVYTETYIHRSYTQTNDNSQIYDISGKGLNKPNAKCRRSYIVHAAGENGFIPNGFLIFKSGSKNGDHTSLLKWVRNQLLPQLPERCVLVVDNSSFHNVSSSPSITSAARKAAMISWLMERNLPFHESMTKLELYDLIKEKKTGQEVRYKLDDLLELHGHEVLRLPPHHPELNPIEKVFAKVKKLDDVGKLIKGYLNAIDSDQWKKIYDYIKSYEQELIEKEHLMDQAFDTMQFTFTTCSSDESSCSLSKSEFNSLNGVEALSDDSSEENFN